MLIASKKVAQKYEELAARKAELVVERNEILLNNPHLTNNDKAFALQKDVEEGRNDHVVVIDDKAFSEYERLDEAIHDINTEINDLLRTLL